MMNDRNYCNKKVLVLGGNGFIGKNVCKELYNGGAHVVAFDRVIDSTCKCSEAVNGDFFNDEELFRSIDQVDYIFHAVSTITTNNCSEFFVRGYQLDLAQGVKMFDYAARHKKKVIFLSSGGTVYGNPKSIPTPEDEPTAPVSHYGVLKRALESAANVVNNTHGTYIYTVRLSNPYGPGQDFKKGIGFIDAVLKKAINHEEISIWGDGTIVRDYIYIDDACKIMCSLLDYDGEYTIINVGTGIGTSQNTILDAIKTLGLDVQVNYCPARSFDVKANILNVQRMKSIYKNELVPLETGIRLYYDYILGAAK